MHYTAILQIAIALLAGYATAAPVHASSRYSLSKRGGGEGQPKIPDFLEKKVEAVQNAVDKLNSDELKAILRTPEQLAQLMVEATKPVDYYREYFKNMVLKEDEDEEVEAAASSSASADTLPAETVEAEDLETIEDAISHFNTDELSSILKSPEQLAELLREGNKPFVPDAEWYARLAELEAFEAEEDDDFVRVLSNEPERVPGSDLEAFEAEVQNFAGSDITALFKTPEEWARLTAEASTVSEEAKQALQQTLEEL